MKKLIFAAAIALVAVGGALTVNAQYLPTGTSPINCTNTPSPSCAIAYGQAPNTPIYDKPAGDPSRVQIGVISQYTYTGE